MKKDKRVPAIFPAVIPLLFQTLDWHKSFLMGGLITFAFWATGFFFSATRSFFPRPFAITAPFLWIVALAQSGRYLGIDPRWILSLLLLLPFSFVKQMPQRFPKEPEDFFWIKRGLAFWALLLYLAVFQEFLGKRLGLLIFRGPAGSWILLGTALVLWPAEGEVRHRRLGLSGTTRPALKEGRA